MNHVVALSGGKDSTAMALRLRELHPEIAFQYVCTPTGNEPPELFEHLTRLERIIGSQVQQITAVFSAENKVIGYRQRQSEEDCFESLCLSYKALPNWRARWCTRQLKIEPMEFWLRERLPVTHYVGLRADEETRIGWTGEIDGISHKHPMREWGWGIGEVAGYLESKAITVPEWTDCDLCFFKRLSQWKRLRTARPEKYAQGERLESEIGHSLRSRNRDTWPAFLSELGKEFDSGRKLRGEGKIAGKCDQESLCRICSL